MLSFNLFSCLPVSGQLSVSPAGPFALHSTFTTQYFTEPAASDPVSAEPGGVRPGRCWALGSQAQSQNQGGVRHTSDGCDQPVVRPCPAGPGWRLAGGGAADGGAALSGRGRGRLGGRCGAPWPAQLGHLPAGWAQTPEWWAQTDAGRLYRVSQWPDLPGYFYSLRGLYSGLLYASNFMARKHTYFFHFLKPIFVG